MIILPKSVLNELNDEEKQIFTNLYLQKKLIIEIRTINNVFTNSMPYRLENKLPTLNVEQNNEED